MISDDSTREELITSQEDMGFYSLLGKYQNILNTYESLDSSDQQEFENLKSKEYEYFNVSNKGVESDYPLTFLSLLDTNGYIYIRSTLSKFDGEKQYVSRSGSEDSILLQINNMDENINDVFIHDFLSTNSSASCPDEDACSTKDGSKRVTHKRTLMDIVIPYSVYGQMYFRVGAYYSAEWKSQKKLWGVFWWIRNKDDKMEWAYDFDFYTDYGSGMTISKNDNGNNYKGFHEYSEELFTGFVTYNGQGNPYNYIPGMYLTYNSSAVDNDDVAGLSCWLNCP